MSIYAVNTFLSVFLQRKGDKYRESVVVSGRHGHTGIYRVQSTCYVIVFKCMEYNVLFVGLSMLLRPVKYVSIEQIDNVLTTLWCNVN